MIGHWRITLLGKAGAKKTRLLRYHEADGVELLPAVQRLVEVLTKSGEVKNAAVTRITMERIDAAGHVV